MAEYITVGADDRVEARNGVIKLHGPEGFEGMRRAGRLAAECLDMLTPHVVPGVLTSELDRMAQNPSRAWRVVIRRGGRQISAMFGG